MDEGRRAQRAPRQLSGRGVSYWTDGKGDDRIVYVTIGYRLVELNAHTGQPVKGFGQDGVVDLKQGVVIGKDKQIDLEAGEIGLHSTPPPWSATWSSSVPRWRKALATATAPTPRVWFALSTRRPASSSGASTPFRIRANRATKPGKTARGNGPATPACGRRSRWIRHSALVYLPVESPTIDTYGGNRPGNDLYAESLVAVDLKTGTQKWHFQLVHHPIWDHDISSAPLLIDATIDGKPRKLVAQPTKQSYLYVFDRITGQPIWPMPEKAGSADGCAGREDFAHAADSEQAASVLP